MYKASDFTYDGKTQTFVAFGSDLHKGFSERIQVKLPTGRVLTFDFSCLDRDHDNDVVAWNFIELGKAFDMVIFND